MKLTEAQGLTESLVAELSPFCHVLRVAGSIRRGAEEVKDIELVAVPKWGEKTIESGLFPETVPCNLLYEHMQSRGRDQIAIDWIKPSSPIVEPWTIKPDGKYWRGLIAVADGQGPITVIKLDFFLARHDNFGVIYTIRTGSADFSRELVTYARDKTPYRVAGGELTFSGPVKCPDEETLFAALQLRWVEPSLRRGAQDIIPV